MSTRNDESDCRRGPWVWGGLVTLVALSVYAMTLCPSVVGGDSGELVGVSLAGGIAHPPGYPLYSLMVRGLIQLSPLNPAMTANLFSAICGAASAGFLTATLFRLTKKTLASVIAGLLWALHPISWEYAGRAEVFTLNTLFMGLSIFLISSYAQRPNYLLATVIAFLLGLGASHHQTFIFWGMPAGLWLCARYRKQPIKIFFLAAVAMVGFWPYLYLPISAHNYPVWGWGDHSHWTGVLRHILRLDYGTFRLGSWQGEGGIGAQLALYLHNWAHPSWIGLLTPILGGVAMIWMFKSRPRPSPVIFIAALSTAVYLLVFHGLANPNLSIPLHRGVLTRFWIMPDWLICFLAGWCLAQLAETRPHLSRAVLMLIASARLLTEPMIDCRRNDYWDRIAVAAFKVLPQGSIVLVDNDAVYNVLRYAQLGGKKRQDVAILHFNLMAYSWYAHYGQWGDVVFPAERYSMASPRPPGSYDLLTFLAANRDRHPIYVFDWVPPEESDAVKKHYYGLPSGVLMRLVPMGRVVELPPRAWVAQSKAALDVVRDLGQPEQFDAISWEHFLSLYVRESIRRHSLLTLPPFREEEES